MEKSDGEPDGKAVAQATTADVERTEASVAKESEVSSQQEVKIESDDAKRQDDVKAEVEETETEEAKGGDIEQPTGVQSQVTTQSEKPKKPIAKKIGLGVVGIVMGAILLVGGIALSKVLSKRDEVADTPVAGDKIDKDEALGSGTGEALEDVALLRKNDQLTLAFLKMHNEQKNSCYSPLSVRYALEMLRAGADGETKAQIDKLLGDTTVTRYENVAEHLSLANALWITPAWNSVLLPSYSETLKRGFGAEVKVDEFRSAANINSWIERSSLGMLKDVLQDTDVQGLNAALVNVLSIDMRWEKEYDKIGTTGRFFNFDYDREDNKFYETMSIRTEGTQNDGRLYYNLADEATVFAQDLREYNGTRLQYVAIMPDDLGSYVAGVTNDKINALLEGLHEAKAQNDTYKYSFTAYMPRFEIDGGIDDLIEDLKDLGVEDAFDSAKADFSKMFAADDFAISAATHKTKFNLSEEGIRAAAVTVAGGLGAGGYGPIPSSVTIVISIHKPFMYLVRDVENGEVWFVGTVYEPELSEQQPEY